MKVQRVVKRSLEKTERKKFRDNPWGTRHVNEFPIHPVSCIVTELARYADWHESHYGTPVGDDGVLGDAWLDAIKAMRRLLDGDLGQLDAGTIDTLLADMAVAAGFDSKALD